MPLCFSKSIRLGGGTLRIGGGRLRYYHCPECDCKFKMDGEAAIIMTDEPDLPFKSVRQMLKVLRQRVRDDHEWFNEVQPDTQDFGKQVVRWLK